MCFCWHISGRNSRHSAEHGIGEIKLGGDDPDGSHRRRRHGRCGCHDPAGEHDRGEDRIPEPAQGHQRGSAASERDDHVADLPASEDGANLSDTEAKDRVTQGAEAALKCGLGDMHFVYVLSSTL